jgi:NTE family protein
MSSEPFKLANVATFNGLSPEHLALLEARLLPIHVPRGACIVTESDEADALFVVLSGRFAVEIGGHSEPVTEIGQGATIGEIAFFSGGARTATVRAIRDSVVVRLSRMCFDEITARSPAIWNAIASTLASRLAAQTRKNSALRASPLAKTNASLRPRTIALIRAGPAPVPARFIENFMAASSDADGTLIVTSSGIGVHVTNGASGDAASTEALNDLEARFHTIVFIADNELTPWSEKAIRQADAILAVAAHPTGPLGGIVPHNALEEFAFTLHKPSAFRLAILHQRAGAVQGTRHWLGGREPHMHHHVALDDTVDMARLWRFLRGDAIGFVACGGGAFCAAHIGVYKAFREAGTSFDFFGGTSGGAAMTAAFAQDIDPEEIDARVHRMFIEGKALARYTLPRYSLLDHTHFDAHLQTEYGNVCIEDVWKPYFAVSADLSNAALEVHRTGPLWEAIRSSAAIPGLLPPYCRADGRMLVDGSVIANVPVEVIHALKSGPNVIVSFDAPGAKSTAFDYAALPGRRELLWKWVNPFAAGMLPNAPSAATVLVRSLMANRGHYERHLGPEDWLLIPPTPDNMGALDWRRHTEIMAGAYRHTQAEIERRKAANLFSG